MVSSHRSWFGPRQLRCEQGGSDGVAIKGQSCHFSQSGKTCLMSTSSAASNSPGFGFGPIADLPDIPASVLKNKFSEVARLAAREPLAVTRHKRREFVILTASHYEALQKSRIAPLASLTT